jgi:hypothetical protein
VPLDATTTARLIRLRTLLAAATAQAADTTSAGRHFAVIALDGVLEQPLLLAASPAPGAQLRHTARLGPTRALGRHVPAN